MAISPAAAILQSVVSSGAARTHQTIVATLCLAFLAGAYIGLGGLFAVRVSGAMPPEFWGSLQKLVFGMVFPTGLLLVVLCGADLFTGNCLSLSAARFNARISWWRATRSGFLSYFGNFLGAIFIAWALVKEGGILFEMTNGTMPWGSFVVKLANAKTSLDPWEAFWRGVGCNWLVCLAIYAASAAKDTFGKICALWGPTMAFAAIGFEHCIANMFFIPAAWFVGTDPRYLALAGVPQIHFGLGDVVLGNLLPVTIGNFVGGFVFVAGFYCLIHWRELNALGRLQDKNGSKDK